MTTNPKTLYHKISLAYWPRPELNESANREMGDAFVDNLTLGQLRKFFEYATFKGPTYCMVARRVAETLQSFPPQIENKKQRAIDAVDAAKSALKELELSTAELVS